MVHLRDMTQERVKIAVENILFGLLLLSANEVEIDKVLSPYIHKWNSAHPDRQIHYEQIVMAIAARPEARLLMSLIEASDLCRKLKRTRCGFQDKTDTELY